MGECGTVTVDDALNMIRTIRRLHDDVGEFLSQCGHQPRPGSKAAAELSSFQRRESLETAFSQGDILIEVAADQLMAFVRTVTEPVQTVAPWTCVRALIESSALALWILDPNVDAVTRVRRSLAFRYEGLTQQVKVARASRDEAGAAKAAVRVDDLERVAVDLGFSRVENRSGKRIGVAQEMPSITNLVASALDEEVTYRLLSAIAHGHPWALQQVSFRCVEDEELRVIGADSGVANGSLLEKSLGLDSVLFLSLKAVTTFLKPISHKSELFGWDRENLAGVIRPALRTLGIKSRSGC